MSHGDPVYTAPNLIMTVPVKTNGVRQWWLQYYTGSVLTTILDRRSVDYDIIQAHGQLQYYTGSVLTTILDRRSVDYDIIQAHGQLQYYTGSVLTTILDRRSVDYDIIQAHGQLQYYTGSVLTTILDLILSKFFKAGIATRMSSDQASKWLTHWPLRDVEIIFNCILETHFMSWCLEHFVEYWSKVGDKLTLDRLMARCYHGSPHLA